MLASLLILGLVVKGMKGHYSKGTSSLTYIGTNEDVVDYFTELNNKDIEFAGKVDIDFTGLEELMTP